MQIVSQIQLQAFVKYSGGHTKDRIMETIRTSLPLSATTKATHAEQTRTVLAMVPSNTGVHIQMGQQDQRARHRSALPHPLHLHPSNPNPTAVPPAITAGATSR